MTTVYICQKEWKQILVLRIYFSSHSLSQSIGMERYFFWGYLVLDEFYEYKVEDVDDLVTLQPVKENFA